jgi:pyruvate formate lyase activating enzyme
MDRAPRCDFCAHHCAIGEGEVGRCGVRENRGGRIVSRFSWEIVGPQIDPVEKKPLYHYYPGSSTFSLAQFGCNFSCDFCQNYHLVDPALRNPAGYRKSGAGELMRQWRSAGGPAVAFTYSEPAVWQDVLIDFAREVRAEGGRCIIVSNGFYGSKTLDRLMEQAEAFNIDFKGPDEFYRRRTGGRQAPVLQSIRALAASAEHVLEVTTLLIEGEHSREEILAMAGQLAEAGVQVWHLSLFHPAYRMKDLPPGRPEFALALLEEISRITDIPHLYLGNARAKGWSDTKCPDCGELLISRSGFGLQSMNINAGACPSCRRRLYGRY